MDINDHNPTCMERVPSMYKLTSFPQDTPPLQFHTQPLHSSRKQSQRLALALALYLFNTRYFYERNQIHASSTPGLGIGFFNISMRGIRSMPELGLGLGPTCYTYLFDTRYFHERNQIHARRIELFGHDR